MEHVLIRKLRMTVLHMGLRVWCCRRKIKVAGWHGVGQVTQYLGYSSLKDFFPTMAIKPNPGCANVACRQLQAAYTNRYNSPEAVAAREAARRAAEEAAAEEAAAVVHEDNEWGIEVAGEDAEPDQAAESGSPGWQEAVELAEGLEYSFAVRQASMETCA